MKSKWDLRFTAANERPMASDLSEIDYILAGLGIQEHRTTGSTVRKERRRVPRTPFPTLQRIAPWDGAIAPQEADYFRVTCRDLSRAGFSFLFPQRPDFWELVAELRTFRETLYLAAEVCHMVEVVVSGSGEVVPVNFLEERHLAGGSLEGRRPTFLVGCRFLRRMRTRKLRR